MMHRPDEVIVYKEIIAEDKIFRMEEYWEEDDSGYCSVEPLMAKHTRVTVVSQGDEKTIKVFDLDGKEYDKSMELENGVIAVTYFPEFDREKVVRIDAKALTVLK